MAVGKSNRIVVDLDDADLKRQLYSALTEDGNTLKEWFASVARAYLDARADGQQLNFGDFLVTDVGTKYATRSPRSRHTRTNAGKARRQAPV